MNRVPDSWRRMPPLPTTKDLLRIYKIKAKRTLSQNFILDPRILQKFVKTGGEFLSSCIENVPNNNIFREINHMYRKKNI